MNLPAPVTLEVGEAFDAALEAVPNTPAVFLISSAEGSTPYLARTAVLRRRLKRLLSGRARLLDLRAVARRVDYWPTASRLESSVIQYELARRHYPEDYARRIKLARPCYVRLLTAHRFPRTQVTSRLGSTGTSYGPFRTRAAAELFEHECLDLFQVRRCQDDFEPSPEHPGCMYGEMNLCLRPCQQAVSDDEYASEVKRVREFLVSGGHSLLETIAHARDRFSDEMMFEEAARQHRRHEKVTQILKLRDELVCDIDRLDGIAVVPSTEQGAVELFPFHAGTWQDPQQFRFSMMEGKSIDERLRKLMSEQPARTGGVRERQDHLALLAKWFYSSWRDGEWVSHSGDIPYRKLVNAIARVWRRNHE